MMTNTMSSRRLSRASRRFLFSTALALLVAGCGGGGGGSSGGGASEPPPVPPAEPALPPAVGAGELKSATRLGTVTAAQVAQALGGNASKVGGVAPRYAVTAWRIGYLTTNESGQQVLASGLVAVPEKAAGSNSPVISYQHGTIFRDAEAPSNALGAGEPTMVMASLGFIVVAADYVGYGLSKGVPHPYLLAAPTAAAVNDLLTASRTWRNGTTPTTTTRMAPGNGQLFLLGYSEGGYATVAAHRAMQAEGSVHLKQLVATVAGAGPYHVGVTMDELLNRVKDENRLLGALINPGFLRHLGESVRKEVRRALVRELIPDDADVVFNTSFIDTFLGDDIGGMERMSNVHDWAPTLPLRMFHGRDDRTVGYRSATVTLATMLARGAPAMQVTLTDCTAAPSDHLPCVAPFFGAAMTYLATLARDL